MNYRSEIDGLRALAVIGVVLFHAHIPLTGGYVGVDVFFVISGFLITSIIMKEVNEDRFSFKNFWVRRIRRILPAASVVTLVTLCVGYFILSRAALATLSESAIAQSLILSNIVFWRASEGYFSEDSEFNPLLHTWSLSVEEQFYILFPILVVFLFRKNRHTDTVLLICLVCSFLVCLYLNEIDTSASFYLLPSRAWEMLVGAIVAILLPKISFRKNCCELMSVVGILGIIIPMFVYDKNTTFPGWFAVPPVLGTALLILSNEGKKTLVGKMLSVKPLVAIGLASYSIYLWHWPIIVFIRHIEVDISISGIWISLILTGLLSYFSWRYIELPFRKSSFLKDPKKAFLFGGVSSAVILIIGCSLAIADKYPLHVDREINDLELDIKWAGKEYIKKSGESVIIGAVDNDVTGYVLWGDSHGMVLAKVFDDVSNELEMRGVTYLSSGIPPVTNLWKPLQWGNSEKNTVDLNRNRLQGIIESGCKNVILVGRWEGMTNGFLHTELNGKPKEYPMVVDRVGDYPTPRVSGNALKKQLEGMLKKLSEHDVKVWLILQVPSSSRSSTAKDFYRYSRYPTINKKSFRLDKAINQHINERSDCLKILKSIKAENLVLVDPIDEFYGKSSELILHNKKAYYRDDDHLSYSGAIHYMTPQIRKLLIEIKEDL